MNTYTFVCVPHGAHDHRPEDVSHSAQGVPRVPQEANGAAPLYLPLLCELPWGGVVPEAQCATKPGNRQFGDGCVCGVGVGLHATGIVA